MRYLVLVCGLWLAAFQAQAVDKNLEQFDDPALEQRYRGLLEELRCVVCQNQSLADSGAELAQDLRNEVRELLDQGKTDPEVTAFLVQRYGDFVLYRPPLQAKTYLLWFGPVLLLLVAGFVVARVLRRQAKPPANPQLSPEQRAQLAQVLDQKEI